MGHQIDQYLKEVVVRNGSDLHFIAGEPPRARIYGELQILAPDDRPHVAKAVHEGTSPTAPPWATCRTKISWSRGSTRSNRRISTPDWTACRSTV